MTDDMALVDYPHYIYYYTDTMQIKNWPLEGLVVEKQVDSHEPADLNRYYNFKVSILKENGDVNTEYNETNGDDEFVNGVAEFKLKDKEQKIFWGFAEGTKFRVEETDADGFTVFTTVGETTTESTSCEGVTSSPYTLVKFKNQKEIKTAIHVSKEWQGKDGAVLADAPEGASVTFTLFANGNKVTKPAAEGEDPIDRTVTLSGNDATSGGTVTPTTDDYEGAGWTAYFTNLPMYDSEGTEISYTVQETGTWPGYIAVKTGDGITYPAVDGGKIINREYSLALDILKVDNVGTAITTGATFEIAQINDTVMADVVADTDRQATTDTDGKLTFSNLNVGFYRIKETVPPHGYVLPTDATFYIGVTETGIDLLTKEDGKKPSEWDKTQTSGGVVKTFTAKTDTENAKATVENIPGAALPHTGGPGTKLFTILGSLMIMFAGILLVKVRKI